MKKLKTILLVGVLGFALSSCSFLDANPENVVSSDDIDDSKTSIYAEFTGLFSLLQEVAEDLIYVSELRGDIMEPTGQAPAVYQEIYNVEATADNNKLVNPAKYYKLIMNTNQFLREAIDYNSKYPGVIPTATYQKMIAATICIRTWTYLNIGKLYGGAVYYDYSMIGEIDLTQLKYYEFDELIDQLVYFMNTGVDHINGIMRVELKELFNLDNDAWKRISIQPDILLTELYLWQKDYEMAAKRAINLITNNGVADGGDENKDMNRYTLNSGYWYQIYGNNINGVLLNEVLTGVFYDRNNAQINSLQAYFDYERNYYMAPTDRFVDLFRYSQSSQNYSIYTMIQDYGRSYERLGYSVGIASGGSNNVELEINKFSLNPKAINDNAIYLYRAGELYLMLAEALTGAGRLDAADSLINYGPRNVKNNDGSYKYPFNTPIWNSPKTEYIQGVRGRAREPRLFSVEFLSPELKKVAALPEEQRQADPLYEEYVARRSYVLDSIIADETARELGYEGKRWFALLRIARNNDDPDFLAVPVSKKYSDERQASMLYLLRQDENWFFDDGIKNR